MTVPVRRVLTLAIPMAGEQFLIFGIALFDTALAGHLGVEQISAQAVVVRWILFTSVVFNIVVMGGSILVAQAAGQGDRRAADDILSGALTLALLSGLALTLIAIALADGLIGLLGVEQAVRDMAVPYLRLLALSFPFNFMLLSASGCIRGAGNARTPLIVMALANILHAVVAVGLVFGADAGLSGLALATILSRGAGLLVITALLLRGVAGLSLKNTRVRPGPMVKIWRVGSAVGGEQLALRLGQIVNVRLVAALGTQMLATYTVVLNSLAIVLMIGLGFMTATLTIIGQQVGAHQDARVYRSSWRIVQIAWAVMGGLSALFFAWPAVNTLFTGDEAVRSLAGGGLRIILFGIPFEVVNQVLTGALRGSGDTRYPMVVTTIGHWMIRLPLFIVFIGPLQLGLHGIWIAMIIEMGVRAVLNTVRMRGSFRLQSAQAEARTI